MSAAPGGSARRPRPGSGSALGRVVGVARGLPPERRLAALAAGGLFAVLFLPWYQREYFVLVGGIPRHAADAQTGWGAFSFVEAAVLLVGLAVLALLFQRGEGRAFHLPGGDGGVITVAGAWTCVLIVWRIFDKQGAASSGQNVVSYGIEWGIFIALADAALLALAGTRIRRARTPEPPLPGEPGRPPGEEAASWGPSSWSPSGSRASRPRTGAGAEPRPGAGAEPRPRASRVPGESRRSGLGEIDIVDPPELATRRLAGEDETRALPPVPPVRAKRGRQRPRTAPAGPDEQLTIPFEERRREE